MCEQSAELHSSAPPPGLTVSLQHSSGTSRRGSVPKADSRQRHERPLRIPTSLSRSKTDLADRQLLVLHSNPRYSECRCLYEPATATQPLVLTMRGQHDYLRIQLRQ